jgi:CheY-like chemotaxis protein
VDHVSERARILLVDDRPQNLLALEAILNTLDQTLVRAGSGEEALGALLRHEYALILLDAQMPGMDGFETAARIKARERTKNVPIIFLTAVDQDQRLAYRGYAAGAADYITKPFDPWLLRAKVQVFVDLWATGQRLNTQAAFLRRQLEDRRDGVDVLAEFGSRLSSLEEAVTQLADPDGTQQTKEAAVERVGRGVRELRRALDALGG